MADAPTIAADPLAGLIDIPLPPAVSLWPQTWPARVAIVVLLVAGALALWRAVHRFRTNRYRRAALAELKRLQRAGHPAQETAAEIAMLVRRTALTAFPRETVAPLSGPAWLAFLDRTGDCRDFEEHAGRVLIHAPYLPTPPDRAEVVELAALVRRWIKVHHA